jgi:hypothetical protein
MHPQHTYKSKQHSTLQSVVSEDKAHTKKLIKTSSFWNVLMDKIKYCSTQSVIAFNAMSSDWNNCVFW